MRRTEGDYDRGAGARGGAAPGSGCLHPSRRLPVRLLHRRPDHVRRGTARRGPGRLRRGDPRAHERESVPLWRLSEYRGRDPRGRGGTERLTVGFEYVRAGDVGEAVTLVAGDPRAALPPRGGPPPPLPPTPTDTPPA